MTILKNKMKLNTQNGTLNDLQPYGKVVLCIKNEKYCLNYSDQSLMVPKINH